MLIKNILRLPTRTTLPLSPYNRRHHRALPARLRVRAFFFFSCPRRFESRSRPPFPQSSFFASCKGGCTLEDGSYLRGIRNTLHRRDPVADPQPRRFDLVSPFATLTRCPRLIALALALIGHTAQPLGKGGWPTPTPRFSMRDGEISDFAMASRALPATADKHRPISRRFS